MPVSIGISSCLVVIDFRACQHEMITGAEGEPDVLTGRPHSPEERTTITLGSPQIIPLHRK